MTQGLTQIFWTSTSLTGMNRLPPYREIDFDESHFKEARSETEKLVTCLALNGWEVLKSGLEH